MPNAAPTNTFGLTHTDAYDSMANTSTLEDQIKAAGVDYSTHELPYIVGMGGNAVLLFFTSLKTGDPYTVLVVSDRYEIDGFAEDYYYFQGMTRDQAMDGDVNTKWATLYDKCREAK